MKLDLLKAHEAIEVTTREQMKKLLLKYLRSQVQTPEIKGFIDLLLDLHPAAEIPEGYEWCEECQLLTPHGPDFWSNSSCGVCGNTKYSEGCPNCGWSEPEDWDPDQVDVPLHGDGCHLFEYYPNDFDHEAENVRDQHFRWLNRLRAYWPHRYDPLTRLQEMGLWDCSCPRVECFRQPMRFGYKQWYGHGMDCSNHIEWAYNVRCPICGEVFDVSDSNC